MKKQALVITYHVKNCQRVGGFHYFINFLEKQSYDIDWVTCTVSLSWIFRKNDKENLRNFVDLWKGITFEENGVVVRHFSEPVFIPAKIAKALGIKLGINYWPRWKKLRRRMKKNYDVILVEGVGCQYALELKNDYLDAKIIYRPSDILQTFSDVPNSVELERQMIEIADLTLCVDENGQQYYKKISPKSNNIMVLRNPMTSKDDLEQLRKWRPVQASQKSVVYLGVTNVDLDLIEYAALKMRMVRFYIIGPHHRKSYDNVEYLGTLDQNEFEHYLESASVGVSPLVKAGFEKQNLALAGYTRKIISYMKYLLPIVTTFHSNYLNTEGFYVANGKEEFCEFLKTALNYSLEEREALREGYLKVMKLFSIENIEKEFKDFIDTEEVPKVEL